MGILPRVDVTASSPITLSSFVRIMNSTTHCMTLKEVSEASVEEIVEVANP